MRSLEVHVIDTRDDIDGALLVGLLEPDDLDGAKCAACNERVASVLGEFVPFAVVLDDGDGCWLVCGDCSGDVLAPQESVSIEDLFAREEEFDSFDLTDDD
jgi:hypothetical protein